MIEFVTVHPLVWWVLAAIAGSVLIVAVAAWHAQDLRDDSNVSRLPARPRLVEDALDEAGQMAEVIDWPFPVAPRDGREFDPDGRAA